MDNGKKKRKKKKKTKRYVFGPVITSRDENIFEILVNGSRTIGELINLLAAFGISPHVETLCSRLNKLVAGEYLQSRRYQRRDIGVLNGVFSLYALTAKAAPWLTVTSQVTETSSIPGNGDHLFNYISSSVFLHQHF